MIDQINEVMFEWAIEVQQLIKNGWEIKIEYGERRLGVSTRLICTRDNKKEILYQPEDIRKIINI